MSWLSSILPGFVNKAWDASMFGPPPRGRTNIATPGESLSGDYEEDPDFEGSSFDINRPFPYEIGGTEYDASRGTEPNFPGTYLPPPTDPWSDNEMMDWLEYSDLDPNFASGTGSGSAGGNLGGMGGIGSAPKVKDWSGYDDYWDPNSSRYGDADATLKYSNNSGGVNWGLPNQFGRTGWNANWVNKPTAQTQLNDWLLGSYLNGPSALADQVTREFDSQMNMNADRSHQRGMLNDILGAIGGLGGGTGTRLQGFQDTRTGQGAALPGAQLANIGTTRNSINAGALPQANIQSAANTVRGGGDYQAPNAGLPIPAAAQNELNQRYTTSLNNQGKLNESNLNRYAGAANAQLGRASQVAAADQGVDNASWLIGADSANAMNAMRARNPLYRLAGRTAGF